MKLSECKIIHKNFRENIEKELNLQHRSHGKVEREYVMWIICSKPSGLMTGTGNNSMM
jgi:hypothetical protein